MIVSYQISGGNVARAHSDVDEAVDHLAQWRQAASITEARLCPDQRVTFVHPRERGWPLNTARSSSRACTRIYIHT